MITAFLFDIGKVIVDFDFDRASSNLRPYCSFSGDPIENLTDLRHELEIGAITGEAFATAAMARIGFSGTAGQFVACYQEIFTPNSQMWTLIEELSANFPLFLLSNTSDIHHAGLLRDFPIFEAFAGGVFSYSAKAIKPDPRIYTATLQELPIAAETTVYFDDLAENIAAGRRHGLVSFQYDATAHDACLRFLEDILHNPNKGQERVPR
jgi:putative hydrolase of the HAD superfamily